MAHTDAYVAQLEQQVRTFQAALSRAHDWQKFADDEIRRLMKENARLREATRWRSVEEELPEPHEAVLARLDDEHFDAWVRKDGSWWTEHGLATVQHWQPLPEPPQ